MAIYFGSFIAFVGVLVAAFLTAIVAEDYRRFRDGSSLAAALAGEMQSYLEAFDMIVPLMTQMHAGFEAGQQSYMPPFKPPGDPVYDAGVERLGLLGPSLARDLAYTYQNLKAFRESFATITEHYANFNKGQMLASLDGSSTALHRAKTRGEQLIPLLNERAGAEYKLPVVRFVIVRQPMS